MLGNEGNANQELVSEQALQRALRGHPGKLNVLPQQSKRDVQKPKPGVKSAGENMEAERKEKQKHGRRKGALSKLENTM